MKRFVNLVATTVAASAMALAAVVLTTGPATAAPAAAAAVDTCHHATLGGTYICDYGVATATLADGRKQVFVVGPNHAVYSRWQLGGGTWNDSWYSLDGNVWSPVQVHHNDTNHILIEVTGSDGDRYYRHRNGTTGVWNAWTHV
ncbi:hypothetical protein Acy02nite_48680 [Actinoplanes cyaneus]|uniref:PLL-like beta propeller domain-containing protein n=1 Tax=Actinoplanes cyaneus TaxID=52696 RepID=A0A919IKM2_9ACTN|nr:hypothetical protein [Actinoplanes cyaneus]MCW2143152.1 hypothetical protein [Actinoplanes cyaneus]GID66987.1 hypothetical protein Acy02nite_48680 [Actinoplanes cyaneus]